MKSYGTRPRQTPQIALVTKTVPTDRLHSSWLRPRTPYDERAIRTLAGSIRTSGRQHPILVRPHPVIARNYEIVVGELPFQTARFAGLEHLTVVVCSLSDIRALECVLLEDVRRPDLTPFEVAVGYGQLIRTFKYSLADLAKLVGKSERQVAHNLLLLDSPLDSHLDSLGRHGPRRSDGRSSLNLSGPPQSPPMLRAWTSRLPPAAREIPRGLR